MALYDAFISYSHAKDKPIQRAPARIAPPHRRARATLQAASGAKP
jgi:hypothetical protein